jgi:hypothetical protein
VIGTGKNTGNPTLNFSPGYQFRKNVRRRSCRVVSPITSSCDCRRIGFVDPSNDDYHLASSSPYRNAGTDGKDIGADIDGVLAATRGVTDLGATQVEPPSQPVAVSVSPSSGQGSPQTFQLVYSDGDGFADIASTYLLVNSSLTEPRCCAISLRRTRCGCATTRGAMVGPVAAGSLHAAQQ